ncbi:MULTISPECIES: S41 family peptidase [Proteiniphilum]|uniref:S41 family peptidase n=1 Tax=Proteiniphilum TaxID=294702 RepID=UPI001EEA5103|nr:MULTISPECIES: S41 family peptidase [Proteiniphilum]ULB35065.1 S41 family peptidase [Proteiniphilum propionicum]
MYKQIIITALSVLLAWGNLFAQFRPSPDGVKLERTIQLIKSLYVDDVDSKKLAEAAIRAMLAELDPHSSYLNEEEVLAMNEPLQGNFNGIGISFNMLTDTLYVMEVISGGPSQKVGILPGDKIIQVNDTTIAGVKMGNQEVVKRLRGPKGTVVNVKIQRRGVPGLMEFRIVRDKIPITSIDASYMVTHNVGYIRLSRFGVTSGTEFKMAERELRSKGMKHLILDLTDNGGGILQTANEIADEFLGENKLIVYTEGKNQPRFTMNASGNDELKGGKLVVLVNGASASASEILAGAIQDWDRGVVVGRRTFGKGLVQRQLPLPDGTMIRLTVARYYTPTGRSIQKPYETGNIDAYNRDFVNRYNHGELFVADSIRFPDSLRYTTLVNKRTVYGGGGIMPDYFVPMDTTSGTMFHANLNAKGIINRAAISEVDIKREVLLQKYPDVLSFNKGYIISDEVVGRLKNIAKEENVEWNDDEFTTSRPLIFVQFKALMARDLFDSSAFFRIINEENDIFLEGLKIISDDNRYNGLLRGVGSNVGQLSRK